jgi:PAS domain S-box-containing protein
MEPLTASRPEDALEALFETAAVGLVLLDGGGRVVRANPAFARLFGYSAEQADARLLGDLLGSPAEPGEVSLAIERLLAGEPLALETSCRRSDGQPVVVELSGAPLPQAESPGAWCALRDITDQRLVEEQGARAASLHHATLESTADGLLVVDRSGRTLTHNQRFLDMWSIPPDVATGLDSEKLAWVLPQLSDPDGFMARVRQLYADPEVSSCDEIRFRDGRIYERYSQPQRIAGQSVGRVWSFRDVTQRRRAEERLRESQRLLELFFAHSLDGFFFMMLDEPVRWDDTVDKEAVLDYVFAHQRITKVNDALLLQYGARQDQLVGQTPATLFTHDPAYGRDIWRRFFDAGHQHVETQERRIDGTPILVEGDYICLYTADGRIEGHFGIQRDVTSRRREEEELLRSQQQLRDLTVRLQTVREEERTRISREIHDELGQALTGLKLDLAWLVTRLKDRPELLERARSVVTRIDGTMHAVRRIATELRPSLLDDLGVVAAVEWQAEEFERQTGIACSLAVRAAHLDIGDRLATTIFRILQEALTNVARHAAASQVTIELTIGSTDLTLEVRDDGRGISADEIAAPRSLGLVGIRERAIGCGGELVIARGTTRGTTLWVRIPLVPERAEDHP